MGRIRRKAWDEPRHDFTAGPPIVTPESPHERSYKVYYQGFPTLFWIRQVPPLGDCIFRPYIGAKLLREERWYPEDLDDALACIAEHMDYLGPHGEALVDRTKKPAPASSDFKTLYAKIAEVIGSEACVSAEDVMSERIANAERLDDLHRVVRDAENIVKLMKTRLKLARLPPAAAAE